MDHTINILVDRSAMIVVLVRAQGLAAQILKRSRFLLHVPIVGRKLETLVFNFSLALFLFLQKKERRSTRDCNMFVEIESWPGTFPG